jgi:methylmalonyl-CoA carboxyltransferase small subunit
MKKLRITVDGKQYDVDVEILEDDDNNGILPSYYNQPSIRNVNQSSDLVEPQIVAPHKTKQVNKKVAGDAKTLTSPLNGIVVEVVAKPGQNVKKDEVLIILEAMKMKTNISSEIDGVIDSIEVKATDRVELGQTLVRYK